MDRKILYYPTIKIPNTQWLRQAVLYYDQVSSIIPQNWDRQSLINLSPDIQYLIEEHQFDPVRPETLVDGQANWDAFDSFQQEFREIVSEPGYISKISKRRDFKLSHIHSAKTDVDGTSRIHSNKTSDGLFFFLEELGLARRSDDPEWLQFEEHTALLYMSLLAKYLADIDEHQTTIGTDCGIYERYNFRKVNDKENFPVISVSLENILPVPRPGTSLKKIVQFKRDRNENLTHFKKTLSDFQVKISKAQSQAEFKEICITFKETIANGMNDMTDVLRDSRIETFFKGFRSLISFKSPPGIAAAGAVLNEYLQIANIPFNYEAFSIGAFGLVEIGGCYIDARNRERARLRESPFSYLYYAERQKIINRSKIR